MHFGRDVSKALLKAEEELGGRGFRQFSSTNSRLSSMNPEVLPPDLRPRKKRVVVLGSGWGAHAFVKVVDTDKFDVLAISPRPYFIFTPMLASSAVGTVEYRSITEPMRASNPLAEYYEAEASEIDTENKLIHCKSSQKATKDTQPFRVPYDYLVVSVGMEPNTFGIPGVKEHCYFLKEVDDARSLRSAIVDKFEAASLPSLSDEERIDLLTFVVVGGGPTGVEFSGELFDFLQQDVKRFYPKLAPLVRTKLLQSGKGVLETFDKNMQDMALSSLLSSGVEVILNARGAWQHPYLPSQRGRPCPSPPTHNCRTRHCFGAAPPPSRSVSKGKGAACCLGIHIGRRRRALTKGSAVALEAAAIATA